MHHFSEGWGQRGHVCLCVSAHACEQGGTWEISVLCTQFCCEPKIALKIFKRKEKVYLKGKKKPPKSLFFLPHSPQGSPPLLLYVCIFSLPIFHLSCLLFVSATTVYVLWWWRCLSLCSCSHHKCLEQCLARSRCSVYTKSMGGWMSGWMNRWISTSHNHPQNK